MNPVEFPGGNPIQQGERRLFPNSGFRHSELGSKIFNAPKAHKYKELINVSEIVQLIEITSFLMEHVSCSPGGIME